MEFIKENPVNIIKRDKQISIRNDEIMVNCKSIQDADDLAETLDVMLNKGDAVVSIDYMDFLNGSDRIEYSLELYKDIAVDNCSESICKTQLSDNHKCIICIVGNVTLADATGIIEKAMSDEGCKQAALFGFVYDEIHQENKFDMYIFV